MSKGLKVTIAGLDFYGEGLHELQIKPDGGFEGWDDGVDMRLENTARPQAHGSFDLPVFRDSRTVALSGNVFADSPEHLTQLQNSITGVLAGGQRDVIQVEQDGEVQWANCRLAAKTMFTREGTDWGTYQIQVWCPDSRKFGRAETYTAAVGAPLEVGHRGNYPATPSFVVRGNFPGGYTITLDGWNYTVTVPVTSGGSAHYIDYNTGHLVINGTIRQNSIGETNVTTVPPGKTVGFGLYPVTTGTGTAEMLLPDTYS